MLIIILRYCRRLVIATYFCSCCHFFFCYFHFILGFVMVDGRNERVTRYIEVLIALPSYAYYLGFICAVERHTLVLFFFRYFFAIFAKIRNIIMNTHILQRHKRAEKLEWFNARSTNRHIWNNVCTWSNILCIMRILHFSEYSFFSALWRDLVCVTIGRLWCICIIYEWTFFYFFIHSYFYLCLQLFACICSEDITHWTFTHTLANKI